MKRWQPILAVTRRCRSVRRFSYIHRLALSLACLTAPGCEAAPDPTADLVGPVLATSVGLAPATAAGSAPAGVEAGPAPRDVPPGAQALVDASRQYLGRRYHFGGRGAELDCMGLVFVAWSDAGRGPWSRLSVNPTELVSKGQLGDPVDGLSPVASDKLDPGLLVPGDVLFFLGAAENPAEPALATLDGEALWVWHMGMYSGGPNHDFIVGDHYAGQVVEEPLPAYLARHTGYVAVYAVRPP